MAEISDAIKRLAFAPEEDIYITGVMSQAIQKYGEEPA